MFILLANDQKQYGPATAEQVREWILAGRADQATLARSDAQAGWKPLGTFSEFAGLFTTPAPPPLLSANALPPRVNSVPVLRPKKFSLMLGPAGPMTRERAWVCLTTNLSLPGFGSIFGRRKIGYAQIFLTLLSFAITTIYGLAALAWHHANAQRLQQQEDPYAAFGEIWSHIRWPLFGATLFAIAFLWALLTSVSLLGEARREKQLAQPFVPPKT